VRFVVIVAVPAAGTASCNALLGNEEIAYVDGDAIAPGNRDGSGDDGRADGADPGLDAGVIDGDASELLDANIPVCDSAAFCSDFDPPWEVSPFEWGSAFPASPGAGVFMTDQIDVRSSPNSLRVDLQLADAPRWLQQSISGSLPLRVYVDVFVRANGAGDVTFLSVLCGPSPSSVIRAGVVGTTKAALAFDADELSGPIVPPGDWLRMLLEVTSTSTSLTRLGASWPAMSIPKTCAGPFVVRLGFPSVGPSSPADTWTVLFDSVRVTVGP
jgi:hypothetical protein